MSKITEQLKDQALLDRYWETLKEELSRRSQKTRLARSDLEVESEAMTELRNRSYRFMVELTQAFSNRIPTEQEKTQWNKIFELLREITNNATKIRQEEEEAILAQMAAVERSAELARANAARAKDKVDRYLSKALNKLEEEMAKETNSEKRRRNLREIKEWFSDFKDQALDRIDQALSTLSNKFQKIKSSLSRKLDHLLKRRDDDISSMDDEERREIEDELSVGSMQGSQYELDVELNAFISDMNITEGEIKFRLGTLEMLNESDEDSITEEVLAALQKDESFGPPKSTGHF